MSKEPFVKSSPKKNLPVRGRYKLQLFDKNGNLKAEREGPNGIVDVGLNKILNDMFDGGSSASPSGTWYCGLIDNAGFSALAAGDTMSSHAGWSESTAYTEANRITWGVGAASSRSVTNATTMDFSINATVTINGIFIVDQNTKGGTTGTLWATASFSSPVSASNGDTLKVTYTVSG